MEQIGNCVENAISRFRFSGNVLHFSPISNWISVGDAGSMTNFHSADVSRVRCGQWVLWFLQWIARRSKKTESWSCSLFMAKSSLTQTFVGRFNLTLCRIANEKQRERDDEVNPLQLRLVCYIYFTIVVWHMHRHVLMSEIRIIAAVGNYCQTARMCYITAWNRKLYSNFMFAHTTVHAYSHYTRLCKRITKTQHLPC